MDLAPAQAAPPEFTIFAPAPVSGSCIGVGFWCALAPEPFTVSQPLNARRRTSIAIALAPARTHLHSAA
jgi:hypothetical protein